MSETRSMNKAEKAAKALRDAAEAYRALPIGLKTGSVFGGLILDPKRLEDEADRLDARIQMFKEIMEE